MKKALLTFSSLFYLAGFCHGLYFSPEFIYVTIYEERPVGSFVVQVHAGPGNVTYELGADGGAFFAINSSSGNITVLEDLDREELSSTNGKFTVFAFDDAGDKASATVLYWILDINDHFPHFEHQYYHIRVRESTDVNKGIFSVSAEDGDLEENAEIVYEISDGNQDGMFKLQDSYHCNILVAKALNFELKSSYLLNITASNYPSNFSNWTALSISVTDEDDLPVRFTAYEYHAFVSEDANVATSIVQVSASDQDQLSAPVTYEILDLNMKQTLFVINASTGVISLNGTLDRESRQEYRLQVLARSTFHFPDHATVTISISDVNDNSPVFSNQTYLFAIAENSVLGAFVGQVKATDADQGNNSTFAFSLLGEGDHFVIDPLAGVITVSGLIDREKQENYSIVVIAKETQSVDKYSNNVTVMVKAEDRNDNSPRFSQHLYNVTIQEELPSGKQVVQVIAHDNDSSSNGAVKYSFVPDATGHHQSFHINPNNGSITTAHQLDREKTSEYFLTVKAEDRDTKEETRSSAVAVTILVQDINDNVPKFEKQSIAVMVSEATDVNGTVITVKATDEDAGQNGAISYTINDGNIGNIFRINSSSGTISVSECLDREKIDTYHLAVKAEDGGNKSSMVNLTVYVSDVNDNSPQFKSPDGYQFSVKEGTAGLILGAVEATDIDAGENGEIAFSFVSTPSSPSFRINSSSGVISLAEALDHENLLFHLLIVRAEDRGAPQSRRTVVRVSINVTDINDNAPKFFDGQPDMLTVKNNLLCANVTATDSLVVRVQDLTPANSEIGRLRSFDKDGDAVNAKVFYFVQGNGSEMFSISNQTGAIVTNRQLKREHQTTYNLSVIAENSLASPKLSTAVTLLVIVDDVTDHKPKFTRPQYETEVSESVAPGTSVVQVDVTNSEQATSEFLFKILYEESSPGSRAFLIEPETGLITTQGKLDRETASNYTLKVQAKVLNTIQPPVFSSVVSVFINVSDVDDNPLRFLQPSYQFSVSELSRVGDIIGRVRAEDEDMLDIQSRVYYTILSGNGKGHFNISEDLGTVSLNKTLELDVNVTFFLVIRASYTRVDLLWSRTRRAENDDYDDVTVTVTVRDENNNAPIFTRDHFIGAFYETDVEVNTLVARIQAFDKDLSTYGSVLYSIVYAENPAIFSLGPMTGEVTLFNSSYLVPGKLMYTLEVSAADNMGIAPFNSAEQNAFVYIFVLSGVKKLSLVINVHPEFVREKMNEINRMLRNISEATVIIKEIQEPSDGKSIIYFHAIDDNSLHVLNQEDLNSRLLNKTELINGVFEKWNIQVPPGKPAAQSRAGSNHEFSAVIAALLVVSIGIGLAGIIGIAITCRKIKREKNIYNTSRPDSGHSTFPHATAWFSADIPGIEAFIDYKAEGTSRSVRSQTKYTVQKENLGVSGSSFLRTPLRSSKSYKTRKQPKEEIEIEWMPSLTLPRSSLTSSKTYKVTSVPKEQVKRKYSVAVNQYGSPPAPRTYPRERRESSETVKCETKTAVRRNVGSFENEGFVENFEKDKVDEKALDQEDLQKKVKVEQENRDKQDVGETFVERALDLGDLEELETRSSVESADTQDYGNAKERRVRFDLRGVENTKQRHATMGHVPDIIIITGKGTGKMTADKGEQGQRAEENSDCEDDDDDDSDCEDDDDDDDDGDYGDDDGLENVPADITSVFADTNGTGRRWNQEVLQASPSPHLSAVSDEEGTVVDI